MIVNRGRTRKAYGKLLWVPVALVAWGESLCLMPKTLLGKFQAPTPFLKAALDAVTRDPSEGNEHLIGVNVGQGNFLLHRCYKEGVWRIKVFDAGTKKKEGGRLGCGVESFLRGWLEGAVIEAIIVTHADSDHYNQIQNLLVLIANCKKVSDGDTYEQPRLDPRLKVLIGAKVGSEESTKPVYED